MIAIDPGDIKSAYVTLNSEGEITDKGKVDNDWLLKKLASKNKPWSIERLVIEYPKPRGQAMYTQLVDTIFWIGRFVQAWGGTWSKIDRKDVKMVLCGRSNAKDSNVRAALISLFAAHKKQGGGKIPQIGTKSQPGPLYGFVADTWQALGVAMAWRELQEPDFLA